MAKPRREIPARTHPEIPGPPRARRTLDVRKLERALRKAVDGEVRFGNGSLGVTSGWPGSGSRRTGCCRGRRYPLGDRAELLPGM